MSGVVGLGRFWPPFLSVPVGGGQGVVLREVGLDGFGRYWPLFPIILVGGGQGVVLREVGLDGFGRFWPYFLQKLHAALIPAANPHPKVGIEVSQASRWKRAECFSVF